MGELVFLVTSRSYQASNSDPARWMDAAARRRDSGIEACPLFFLAELRHPHQRFGMDGYAAGTYPDGLC